MAMFQQGITLKALLQSPELLKPPKYLDNKLKEKASDGEVNPHFLGQAAFLGPNLWDKTVSLDSDDDVNLEYLDLDQFLNETGVPSDDILNVNDGHLNNVLQGLSLPGHHHVNHPSQLHNKRENSPRKSPDCNLGVRDSRISPSYHNSSPQPASPNGSTISNEMFQGLMGADRSPKYSPGGSVDHHSPRYGTPDSEKAFEDFVVHPNDLNLVNLPGQDKFDPRKRQFSVEELRPQPMIKKSRKIFTPDQMKDDKYWSRRKKNNLAAKQSRDARRVKENQIAMRAAFLESEVLKLTERLATAHEENARLKKCLAHYEPI